MVTKTGPLSNLGHERFCQEAHKRIWAGENVNSAFAEAYAAAITRGEKNPDSAAVHASSRRLRARADVKGRMEGLAAESAYLACINSGWLIRQAAQRVGDFNLDDYMTKDENGKRFFDIDKATRDQMGRVGELSMEEVTEGDDESTRRIRKIKLKPYDPSALLGLIARVGGFEAPKKTALTDPDGKQLTLEALIGASYQVKPEG